MDYDKVVAEQEQIDLLENKIEELKYKIEELQSKLIRIDVKTDCQWTKITELGDDEISMVDVKQLLINALSKSLKRKELMLHELFEGTD